MAGTTNYDIPLQLPGNPTREALLAMLDDAVRAVRARPGSAMRHCNMTFLLLELGKHEEALEAAEGAVKAGPDSADAHVVRGMALQSLGRLDGALRDYGRATVLDPGRADARNNRGSVLVALGRLAEAVEEFDGAIGADPSHVDSHVGRGRALYRLGRRAEALASLRRAVSMSPDDAEVWLDIGAMLFHAGDMAKSLEAAETAIRIRPVYAKAHYVKGIVLHRLGRRDKARESFGRVRELVPAFVEPVLPDEVDDIYVAWHEAVYTRNRLESPTDPRYALRHHVQSRIAEFLNAARRVLEYHKKQHKSSIVDDYHGMETKARKYLQHVNVAKHERLPTVRITKTGKRRRVYPDSRTGQPMVTIEEGARLVRGGQHHGIDTWPDEMFGEAFGKSYLYEVQVCYVILEDGEVELVEFMDTILAGIKELLERHGYDTSGLADAGPYYGES